MQNFVVIASLVLELAKGGHNDPPPLRQERFRKHLRFLRVKKLGFFIYKNALKIINVSKFYVCTVGESENKFKRQERYTLCR